ncbi:MAG: hypothetical protein H5U07_04225 [Candidatus Aminicenantes bacterium]|nr:hypothetical protein [Candidatus Aminicenantes bacterium]
MVRPQSFMTKDEIKINIRRRGNRRKAVKKTFSIRVALSFLVILLTALGMLLPASAQTVQFSLSHNYASNIFQSYEPFSDQVTLAGLSFGGDSSGVALYGNLDVNYLYKYSGLSSFGGKLGADLLVPVGKRSAFYFALEGEAVLFRSLYDYFNHTTARLIANFKSYLGTSTILRIDSESWLNNYRYAIFDYLAETLTISLDNYFPSKTTFKVEASYGYKLYLHPGYISSAESTDLQNAAMNYSIASKSTGLSTLNSGFATPFLPLSMQGGPGIGHGNPRDNYNMGGSYSIRGLPYQTVYYTGSQNIQVFSISALLAQGLGDNLGLSLSAARQWYLKGENPFSSSDEYFMVENPTYDRFAWEGYSLQAKLTALISDNLNGEIRYDYYSHNFPGIISLDLEGNSLGVTRKDTRHQVSARLQLDLASVSLFASYSYLKNSSNDPWFDWNGHALSAGLVWNLSVSSSR